MLPLIAVAGAIWGYNIAKMVQLSNGNGNGRSMQRKESGRSRLRKRDTADDLFPLDSSGERKLTIFKDCTFIHEDRRVFNTFNNCTFKTYITIKPD